MTSNHILQAAGNGNFAAPSSLSATSSGGFLQARHVLDRYRISDMTLWRWIRDEDMRFPKPVYLARLRYWRISELETWETAQEMKGAA